MHFNFLSLALTFLSFTAAHGSQPLLPAAAPITFEEAYQQILQRSLRIESQRMQVGIAEKRKLQAIGTFLPTVSAEMSDVEGVDPILRPRMAAGLRASVNLFRSGGDLAGIRAANKEIESGRKSLERETQTAQFEAVEALVQYIAQTRLVAIGEKLAEVRTDSLRVARERFTKGLMPQQEVDKTAIDLDITRSRLADTLSALAEAAAKLEIALGHSHVQIEWPWQSRLSKNSEVELMKFDIENRPDWGSAFALTEARRLRKRQAGAFLLPSVDLLATYGSPDLQNSSRRDVAAILTLNIPLFDGFKNWGEYGVEGYREQLAKVQLETVQREAPAQVAALRKTHRFARESAIARSKTAVVTRRLYDDNLQRFRLGRASANDIAIDQSRLLESQQLEVQGWLSAHLTLLRLCHSLGGFVEASGDCRAR